MGLLKPLLKDISIGNRILPSLALRFADNTYQLDSGSGLEDKTFADIITFTRASGGGRFNASGVYEWLGNDVPRLDYDPVTLQPRGILIEEQRTNLLTYSDMSTGWTIAGGGSLTPNNVLAPDGTITAAKFTFPSSASVGLNYVRRFVTTSTGVTTTCTVFIKSTVPFTLRRPDGVITAAQPATSDWTLITLSVTAGTGFNFDIRSESTSAGDIQIWHPQIEAGAFPTSYIPTVASQVTRSADVASVNTLSPWYNANEGTLFVEWSPAAPRSSAGTFNASLGQSSSEYIGVGYVSAASGQTNQFYVVASGTSVTSGSTVLATGVVAKAAASYNADGSGSLARSGAVNSYTHPAGRPPLATGLYIGRGHFGGTPSNGHIRNISYYPRAYSGIVLQEMT